MTLALVPNSILVAVAWIASIDGLTASGTGMQLPSDETSWADNGYITVKTTGGSPDIYTGMRHPVVQVDCWADVISSDKLPWNSAFLLAEQVINATFGGPGGSGGQISRPLTILGPDGVTAYPTAWVYSAQALSEPHPAFSDAGDYAGASFDMQIDWGWNRSTS